MIEAMERPWLPLIVAGVVIGGSSAYGLCAGVSRTETMPSNSAPTRDDEPSREIGYEVVSTNAGVVTIGHLDASTQPEMMTDASRFLISVITNSPAAGTDKVIVGHSFNVGCRLVVKAAVKGATASFPANSHTFCWLKSA